jgi:dihydroneopterin aldolase
MDIVYLNALKVDTIIGIYPWERQVPQTLVLDIEMAADIRPAAASDNIDDTLNYKAVAKRVSQFVTDSEFLLVETLAENIVQLIMHEFAVPWVRLKLDKRGAVRGARGVGLIIERGQCT